MGRDLLAMGISPGPGMGVLLKALYRLQLENEFQTKAQGLKAAKRLIQGGKS
jgi:tRNA nucleotidyltransferase (CCA-adding enzyme)